MIIGRVTDRPARAAAVQLGVSASLRGHAAEGGHAGLPQPQRGLDRLGNNAAPFQSPEATSTAARGYFDAPYYLNQVSWTMPTTNKFLLDANYTSFRYNPLFGFPRLTASPT